MSTAAPPTTESDRASPSSASQRGLDWFIFCVADIQTGFGPFIAVYLTTQKWTQADIGLVLTIGGVIGLIGQMPGGAIVDAVRSERLAAALGVVGIGLSALILAIWPIFIVVVAARILHAAASCVLGPAMAAISLGLVGHAAIGERLGRNARFASIGNGLSAAVMGAFGYFLSSASVFFVTAALVIPALFALFKIRADEIDPEKAHGGVPQPSAAGLGDGVRLLLHNRPLLILAACMALFHLANAAMLPLVATTATKRTPEWAPILIATCIVLPQIVVAAFSPWVGRHAQMVGRKSLLLAGFFAMAARGALFAFLSEPYFLVAIQLLDGISAAVLGVLVPLIVADATRGTGRFNLAQGIVGTAIGIGASMSGLLAGYSADVLGSRPTFLLMSLAGLAGAALVWRYLPETRTMAVSGAGPRSLCRG